MSEHYDSPELLTLEDEDGVETTFEILDTMDLDGKTYVALTPYFENPEEMLDGDAELVVLVSETVDGEEYLASIEDDEEYDQEGALFLVRLMSECDDEETEYSPAPARKRAVSKKSQNRKNLLLIFCTFFAILSHG